MIEDYHTYEDHHRGPVQRLADIISTTTWNGTAVKIHLYVELAV